jgi:hypothetical protein
VGAFGGLVAADARDPNPHAVDGSLHGLHLVDVTAQVRVVERQTANEGADKGVPARVAAQVYDVQVPLVLDFFAEGQRLPEVVARVEKEDADVGLEARCHMQERHGLRLERRTHGDVVTVLAERPFQNLVRGLALELVRKLADFFCKRHRQAL